MPRFLLAGVCLATSGPALSSDWLQFGYDAAHSGHNPTETVIGPDNVGNLVLRYAVQVGDGTELDGAPVFAASVATAAGPRDIVYALNRVGTLFAIDADNGSVIWFEAVPGPYAYPPTSASPAIDKTAGFIYSYGLDGRAHKFRLGDGAEISTGGWPQIVTLSYSDRVSSSFTISHSVSGSFLYAVTASEADNGPYHGHLTSIDLGSGAQNVFNVMCSNLAVHFVDAGTPGVNDCAAIHGGMWSRAGAVFDGATKRLYVTSGNGVFDGNTGGHNWGDTVIKLTAEGSGFNGRPLDSFTPVNYADLDHYDEDLGESALTLIPTPSTATVRHLGSQVGKDGILYFINLDNMNGTSAPGGVGGELLSLPGVPGGGSPHQAAVWVDPADPTSTWIFSGSSAYQITFESNLPNPHLRWTGGCTISSPVVANGVVYSFCGHYLFALDVHSGTVLWSSQTGFDFFAHWQSPIIVAGALYVTDSGKLWKFALPLADPIFSNGFDGSLKPGSPFRRSRQQGR